jgi:hypothetical protein
MEMPMHDRAVVPDDQAFRAAVGAAADLWGDVCRHVADGMGARALPSWGGRSGWEIRYRRAGRPFVTLTPGTDSFQACVVLGRNETVVAETLALGPATRAILDGARRFPDGTWLFIPVRSAQDVADLLALLEIKLPARTRRALAGVV